MELRTYPIGDYQDRDNNRWTATLELSAGADPTVLLVRDGSGRKDRYRLSQFLAITAGCSDFTVAGLEHGDQDFTFGASKVNALAIAALCRLTALDGRFEIRWVPNDPDMPF